MKNLLVLFFIGCLFTTSWAQDENKDCPDGWAVNGNGKTDYCAILEPVGAKFSYSFFSLECLLNCETAVSQFYLTITVYDEDGQQLQVSDLDEAIGSQVTSKLYQYSPASDSWGCDPSGAYFAFYPIASSDGPFEVRYQDMGNNCGAAFSHCLAICNEISCDGNGLMPGVGARLGNNEEVATGTYSIYPNLASEKIHISTDHIYNTPASILIVDMMGNVVWQRTSFNLVQDQVIDISKLTVGSYNVLIKDEVGHQSLRFLKQN